MSKIIIVGHKNPDTDSVISAIAMQEFFYQVLGKEAKAYRAGLLNNETKFILEKFEVKEPELVTSVQEGDVVALVDHNQPAQAFEELDYEKVEYIIDHHNIKIETQRPIHCRMAPLGSTSSVISQMFFEAGLEPSEKVAKLLISGILSDTLNLTSPTTTNEDEKLVEKLNAIAKLDVEEFVAEMFKAKSSLEGISVQDIITLDYKVFEMGTRKVGIGAWETTSPESVDTKKDEIIQSLVKEKEADKLDYMYFMVVDILRQNSQLYIVGEDEKILAEKVFGQKTENNAMVLPGIVSRKKQVVPPLTAELSK